MKDKVEDNAHFVQTDGQSVELYQFGRGDVRLKGSLEL